MKNKIIHDGVTLYANRGDYTPLVEVTDRSTLPNHCSNGAETDDEFDLDNGDALPRGKGQKRSRVRPVDK